MYIHGLALEVACGECLRNAYEDHDKSYYSMLYDSLVYYMMLYHSTLHYSIVLYCSVIVLHCSGECVRNAYEDHSLYGDATTT